MKWHVFFWLTMYVAYNPQRQGQLIGYSSSYN